MGGQVDKTADNVRSLGEALGVSKTRAATYAREPWFPAKGPHGWDVDACLLAVAKFRRGEVAAPVATAAVDPSNELVAAKRDREVLDASAAATAEAVTAANLESDRDDLRVLDVSRDPVALAKVAMSLAARRFKRAHEKGDARDIGKAMQDLTRSVEQLRLTEGDYIELARERGELIERSVAKACMGALGRRFNLALDRLSARNAGQLEIWLGDGAFLALSPDERARRVRAWTGEQTRAARVAESSDEARAEIERMVAAEVNDWRD